MPSTKNMPFELAPGRLMHKKNVALPKLTLLGAIVLSML